MAKVALTSVVANGKGNGKINPNLLSHALAEYLASNKAAFLITRVEEGVVNLYLAPWVLRVLDGFVSQQGGHIRYDGGALSLLRLEQDLKLATGQLEEEKSRREKADAARRNLQGKLDEVSELYQSALDSRDSAKREAGRLKDRTESLEARLAAVEGVRLRESASYTNLAKVIRENNKAYVEASQKAIEEGLGSIAAMVDTLAFGKPAGIDFFAYIKKTCEGAEVVLPVHPFSEGEVAMAVFLDVAEGVGQFNRRYQKMRASVEDSAFIKINVSGEYKNIEAGLHNTVFANLKKTAARAGMKCYLATADMTV